MAHRPTMRAAYERDRQVLRDSARQANGFDLRGSRGHVSAHADLDRVTLTTAAGDGVIGTVTIFSPAEAREAAELLRLKADQADEIERDLWRLP